MKSSVTLQDIALVQTQGGTIGATVEYPGFSNRRNAERAAQRDLRALATPLLSCTIYCGQEAADLDIGDTFKFEWPDYHEGAIVMRVTGMAFGDGRTDRIRIDCVQDVFAAPLESILSEDRGSLWTNPTAPPTNIEEGEASVSSDSDQLVAAATQIATEMPYRQLIQVVGSRLIDDYMTETPDVGLLRTTGKRPISGLQDDGTFFGNAINALIHVDAGSGYVQRGAAAFAPFARLADDIGYITTSVTVIDAERLSEVTIGTFAQIDDELVRVDSISGSTITFGRGILDTVPVPHSAGASILFWQDFAGTNDTEYEATESINVKLQPRNNSGTAPLASAVAMPLTFDSRAIRPYPPGNVKINGVAYPETDLGGAPLVVTWSHRDRLQQTGATFEDTTDGNIGPEAGTTYTVRLEDSLGGVITEETGITGTEWAEQSDASDTDNEIVIKLWSVRDGYASWQQHVIPVLRAPLPVESSSELVSESEFVSESESESEIVGGDYEYEVFTASSTWDWTAAGEPSEVDVLVVAGGGGGGSRFGGAGGGAGGVLIETSVAVAANVSVTIGGGGAGGITGANRRGSTGSGSSFGATSAEGGGGGGGSYAEQDGGAGGSGGGGGYSLGAAGAGTSGQGNDGGSVLSDTATSAGGGGKGSVGADAGASAGGDGGDGITLGSVGWGDAVGAPSAIGGGGGGGGSGSSKPSGCGGSGGGGNGGNACGSTTNSNGSPGSANTGGGGGGAHNYGSFTSHAGGNGGSGLVIVRWIRP
jgi:hypothetical protein